MQQFMKLPLHPSSDISPRERANILIVDDRKENLLATEKVLRNLDASIFKANSGNEALSLILRHQFALVLLDVQMPEMDGFETAMLMQEHESMQGVPIIFVTAISKEEKYANQAAELGAVDYIFKPINPEILRSKVKVYLDLYHQREHIMKLNNVLKQSNEELERFAYICSHDMQEPVRMMNSYADLLHEKYGDLLDEKGRKYVKFITANAERMQTMILDILTFSRIGREEVNIEEVDCELILQEVIGEYEKIIEEKHATITHDTLPTIRTSQTLIRVLLQNLIGNALKFQGLDNEPRIHISAKNDESGWVFSIRDNGIGIDEKYHDHIFTIFQRLHRKEEYAGTGIGLSTCRKFVRIFGGDVYFESTPGKGSVFFFSIPHPNNTMGQG